MCCSTSSQQLLWAGRRFHSFSRTEAQEWRYLFELVWGRAGAGKNRECPQGGPMPPAPYVKLGHIRMSTWCGQELWAGMFPPPDPQPIGRSWLRPGLEWRSTELNKHFHMCLVNWRDVKTMILEISDHCQAALTGNRWQEKVDTNLGH